MMVKRFKKKSSETGKTKGFFEMLATSFAQKKKGEKKKKAKISKKPAKTEAARGIKRKKYAAKAKKYAKRTKKYAKKTKKIARQRTRAQPKFDFLEDKELHDFLHNIVGEEGMTVVKRISIKEVSDVELAETMELKPNVIRKHLYAMYEAGIVTYRRHRSKTGWYTYFWKLHPDRITTAVGTKRGSEIKKLQELLDHEIKNHFYECRNKCSRIIFDMAMETNFKCAKCNETLEFSDNKNMVEELQRRIGELGQEKTETAE